MKKNLLINFATLLSFILIFTIACNKEDKEVLEFQERLVVANRADASLSFIDANTDEVLTTLTIANSEPMYVVYVPQTDKIYVGDRSQNMVHVIDPKTESLEKSIAVGNGVFHMWADGQGQQLWVNTDTDKAVSVIDLSSETVVQTIDLGIKPHDIFVTEDASKVYISILNPDANLPDSIYAFSTANYAKIGAKAVGKDPHVFHLSNSNKLYVPCQSGQLIALNGDDLSEMSNESLTGVHGIFATPDQNSLIVANISDAQLYSINAANSSMNGTPVATDAAKPHNLAINAAGDKVFVTHSGGTANTVSIHHLNSGTITTAGSIIIGTNPFGLAYYKRTVN